MYTIQNMSKIECWQGRIYVCWFV